MPWRQKTIRAVGPTAPVTHQEIRRLVLHLVIPVCVVTLGTSISAGAFAYRLGLQRDADNRHSICAGEWQRFEGREGLRTHFANELEKVLAITGLPESLRAQLVKAEMDQLNTDLPAYSRPTCARPVDLNPPTTTTP